MEVKKITKHSPAFSALTLGNIRPAENEKFIKPCLETLKKMAEKADVFIQSKEIPTAVKGYSTPGLEYKITPLKQGKWQNLLAKLHLQPKVQKTVDVSDRSTPFNIMLYRVHQGMEKLNIV